MAFNPYSYSARDYGEYGGGGASWNAAKQLAQITDGSAMRSGAAAAGRGIYNAASGYLGLSRRKVAAAKRRGRFRRTGNYNRFQGRRPEIKTHGVINEVTNIGYNGTSSNIAKDAGSLMLIDRGTAFNKRIGNGTTIKSIDSF